MKTPIAPIVTDIRQLSESIRRRWARKDNALTYGDFWDANRIAKQADMKALRNCIKWALAHPAGGMLGYRAAERLNAVLNTVEKHQVEIKQLLGAA